MSPISSGDLSCGSLEMTWFFLVAVAAGCEALVTHNRRDFRGIERFGLNALTPQALLKRIGELR